MCHTQKIFLLYYTILPIMRARCDKRGYLYVLPAVILVAVFSYYPFIKAFISSFFIENQLGEITEFVGLENYKALFSNDFFIQSVKTTFLLAAIFVPVNTILTLAAASFVRRGTMNLSAHYISYLLHSRCLFLL